MRRSLAAVEAALPADVAVFAAAVADWRVASQAQEKIKKGGKAAPAAASGKAPAAPADENPGALDLNSAPAEKLMTLNNVDLMTAKKIIAARPFKNKNEIVSKKIMKQADFNSIARSLDLVQQPVTAPEPAEVGPAPETRSLRSLRARQPEPQRKQRLWWSRFRRRHQAGAKRAHIAWRAAQRPIPSLAPSSAHPVVGLSPLSDDLWERLQGLFVVPPHTPGRHEVDYRLIVEGILWLMRTGSAWRSLPTRFGAWSKVLYYYRQWKADGRWARVLQALQAQEVPLRSSA